MLVPLDEILAARERLTPYLPPSPVKHAESYSRRLNAEVFLKLELFMPTGAFKVRGALNALLLLSQKARDRGVVTASAGNHGLGISYAARQLGIAARVFLPDSTPRVRIDTIRALGASAEVGGHDWNEANARALELVLRDGATYISPFDDPAIMAGQGTIALEILEQVPAADTILCSIGGGGLISGIASAVRQLRPETHVVGVETIGADCMWQSLAAGRIVELPEFTSIAQSLGTKRSTERQLAIVQEAVTKVVRVPDEAAFRELLYTLDHEKILAEPAASCTLAALTEGCLGEPAGRTLVPVLCGGNITLEHVLGWLERFGPAARTAGAKAAGGYAGAGR
ncbi:MAG TPA: threonine/serine dehydratase [Trueperaceae bacterium]